MTIRDLMWILTVKLSVSVSRRHNSYVLDINFKSGGSVAISILDRCLRTQDSTHHRRVSSAFPGSECTSFWPFERRN